MRVSFSTEGTFDKIIDILTRGADRDFISALNEMGEEATGILSRVTPRDTGVTAESWDYEVRRTRSGPVLGISNYAHPNLGVNIAILKQIGHGTGTGGYVPPNDYIRPAMNSVFGKAGTIIAKEMKRR